MGVKRLRDLPSFIARGRGGGGGGVEGLGGVTWFQGIKEGLVTANRVLRGEGTKEN